MNVLIYLDRHYVVPATVMVRSLLENTASAIPVRLFVLCLGLTDGDKEAMAASWPHEKIRVSWIDVDISAFKESFASIGYLSQAAYLRLLLDRYLPGEIERVITMDCDGIVHGDIQELWNLGGESRCPVMAVKDCCNPTLGYDRSPFIQSEGIDRQAPYFNSGIMVIDLVKWRERNISGRCLALAERWKGKALYADQSFLNAVLQGDWEPLPPRWNCNRRHLAIHSFPTLRNRVLSYNEVREAQRAPGFSHFCSAVKPWSPVRFHPHRSSYLRYLGMTQCKHQSLPHRNTLSGLLSFPKLCYEQSRNEIRKFRLSRKIWADRVHLVRTMISVWKLAL